MIAPPIWNRMFGSHSRYCGYSFGNDESDSQRMIDRKNTPARITLRNSPTEVSHRLVRIASGRPSSRNAIGDSAKAMRWFSSTSSSVVSRFSYLVSRMRAMRSVSFIYFGRTPTRISFASLP